MGSHEAHAANGSTLRTRANGTRSDVHDASRGIDIHHGLDGSRRVSVERADHSRVFADRGYGYVQHPYMFHGREFGHRTYFEQGRLYDRYYRRYPYHGLFLNLYAPALFYSAGFYGWAYGPWGAPVHYGWGWAGNPWYGYYGGYFTPYPVYASPALWLTDYMIAADLQAAYAGRATNAAPVAMTANAPPALTPEVKQMIADEVKQRVQQESAEAQANALNQDIDPAVSGIAGTLGDNRPHVFVAGSNVDLINDSGRECAISQGDVIEVASSPTPNSSSVTATVLASKGGVECARSAHVAVALNDLQDMQNSMREAIDQGMADLRAKQGTGGLPAIPASAGGEPAQAAFAAGAPPPDANAAAEIGQQAQQADLAERQVANTFREPAISSGTPAATTTIALGQSIDSVTAALGNPTRIIDLGPRKTYIYPDMKITFQNGLVSDVQ